MNTVLYDLTSDMRCLIKTITYLLTYVQSCFYNFRCLPILMSPCSSHSDTTTAPAATFKLETRHRIAELTYTDLVSKVIVLWITVTLATDTQWDSPPDMPISADHQQSPEQPMWEPPPMSNMNISCHAKWLGSAWTSRSKPLSHRRIFVCWKSHGKIKVRWISRQILLAVNPP